MKTFVRQLSDISLSLRSMSHVSYLVNRVFDCLSEK